MAMHWTRRKVEASTLPADKRLKPRLSRMLTVLGRASERSSPAACYEIFEQAAKQSAEARAELLFAPNPIAAHNRAFRDVKFAQ